MNKMCNKCKNCFTELEREKLVRRDWTDKEIAFVENSIVEHKIKELIKWD